MFSRLINFGASKNVYILRGWPGSGKSTICEQLRREHPRLVVCSADHYFLTNGQYVFDVKRLGEAHATCKNKFIKALVKGEAHVAVDNTNIKWSDVKEYIYLAHLARYKIHFVRSQAPWKFDAKVCAARNTHGVPYESIVGMMKGYQHDSEVVDWAFKTYGIVIR
jgi:predicted kinase